MQENVGTYDAYVRLSAGTLALAWAGSRRYWSAATILLALLGATKVAEGVTRFCPLHATLGVTTMEDEGYPALWRVGPIRFRRVARRGSVRTLWGVRQEPDSSGLPYGVPAAVESAGWNWESQAGGD